MRCGPGDWVVPIVKLYLEQGKAVCVGARYRKKEGLEGEKKV